jgi:outer membrane protein assembly factor BamB
MPTKPARNEARPCRAKTPSPAGGSTWKLLVGWSRLGPAILSLVVALALGVAPADGAPVETSPDPQPRWGGSSGANMASEARNLPADPARTEPLWELKLGTHQYSIPTVDRGRIYLAANDGGVERPGLRPTGGGVLVCVDQATGRLIWQLPSPRFFGGVKPPYHYDQWKCGICSGPLVDGDRVYVISGRGEILCLDRAGQANGNDGTFKGELTYMGVSNAPGNELRPTDGDILWRYDLVAELDIVPHDVCGSTLLLCGDFLYACTSNGIDDRHDKIPRPLAPSLIVLDKTTGRLVARDDEKIGLRLLHCNWSSPVAGRVNGRTLIFFGAGDGILYAFEPPRPTQGSEVQVLKKVWAYDCNPPDYRTRDGQLVAYSKHNQNTEDGPSEIIGTPVFHQGRLYVAIGQSPLHGNGRGCLSCVDAATGAKVWASELVERTTLTAAIADGLLYLSDGSGNLHCFEANTGERHWVHRLGAKAWCASPFVADGKVYAGTEANVLWVLKAGRERQVLSKGQLASAPITPTAVDGVLYLPTQKSLIALPGKPAVPRAAGAAGDGTP